MKPFRKHVAIAIDGGGIKGVTWWLARSPSSRTTSTGRTGHLPACRRHLHGLHHLCRHRRRPHRRGDARALYPARERRLSQDAAQPPLAPPPLPPSLRPLEQALRKNLGALTMGDLWSSTPRIDVVITAFDLMQNKTCFIKPWKSEYALWPVVKAVLASVPSPPTSRSSRDATSTAASAPMPTPATSPPMRSSTVSAGTLQRQRSSASAPGATSRARRPKGAPMAGLAMDLALAGCLYGLCCRPAGPPCGHVLHRP